MSLLREIQNAAIDGDVDISVVLRKCKVLAARLGNEEFNLWVERELNGYTSKEELPAYRILHVQSFGHFAGFFGSGLKNAPIPPSSVPEQFRDLVTTAYLMEPISHYASLTKDKGIRNFQSQWPADLIALVGDKIIDNMTCMSAWQRIAGNSIAALLDTVRNRILSFVLEIETVAPDAGEAPPNASPIPEERISQVFQTIILGNVTSLTAGSQTITHDIQVTVVQNDLESLGKFLVSLGIGQQDLEELHGAIQEDAKSDTKGGIGNNVGAWIGRMISKAASGTLDVAATVAANVLTKALLNYYGL